MKNKSVKVQIFILAIMTLFGQMSLAQDTIVVNSKVEKVIVFLKGAQIKRKATCKMSKGLNLINFTKISSHIDDKSIQVKSVSDVSLQSVYFYVNHMDSMERIHQIDILNSRLDSLVNLAVKLENKLFVLKNEQELFKENLVLSGEQKIVNTEELKKASEYYRQRLSEIALLQNAARAEIKEIDSEKQLISYQLIELNNKKEKPVGEVIVLAYTDEPGEKEFIIEYFIENAGWIPKYDIRSESVAKPAILSYRADVYQDTDDDWKNVELTLSSSNPSLGGTRPELKHWTLNLNNIYSSNKDYADNSNYDNGVSYYKNLKNDYSKPIHVENVMNINGTVVSSDDGMGLPGVSILVKGTSIGTITDMDGHYSVEVPKGSEKLIFMFVGMETEELPITGAEVNCSLAASELAIDEVVVTALGISREKKSVGYAVSTPVPDGYGGFIPEGMQGRVSGVVIRGTGILKHNKISKKMIGKRLTGMNTVKENQTSVQFVLDKPYTIPSDSKKYSVDIEKYEIPVHYQYSSVPKLDFSAFLLAQISGWESLNLLSGDVNIYFEGSFVGNSKLDVEKTGDTLDISMGRDKDVMIDRKMKEDYSKKQVFSKWKTESYTWEITVKNNKSDTVNVIVEDQVPVSINNKYEIELLESSAATFDKEKGKLNWKLELAPLEKKVLTFTYQIKIKNS